MSKFLPTFFLLLLLTTTVAHSRSFPATSDPTLAAQERWGASAMGYVLEGCLPTAAGMVLTVPACRGFALQTVDPPALTGFEETVPRAITTQGAGPFWLVARANPGVSPPGWTCVAGTHYCWQQSATQPPWPSGTLPLAKALVTAGAVSSVQPLASRSPMDFAPLDGTVYATQYGLTCDGVTDNSAALQAALAAVPGLGGTIVLPAAELPCAYSETLDLSTKSVTIRGAGGTRANPPTSRSVLLYTGGGQSAIHIHGPGALGTKLIGFELDNSGTTEYGILIDDTASILLDDIGIAIPVVRFTMAAIGVGGGDPNNPPHSIFIQNSYIRSTGQRGVWVVAVAEYVVIENSKILGHLESNVELGRVSSQALGPQGTATDVHILHSTMEGGLQAGSNGIRINRAEGVWVKDNHFEVPGPSEGGTPGRAILLHSTAERCAPVVIRDNRINLLAGASEAITTACALAIGVVEGNFLSDNSGSPTPIPLVTNFDSTHLIVGANRVGSPESVVMHRQKVSLRGNMSSNDSKMDGFQPFRVCAIHTLVGNVGTGEDTLAECTPAPNTVWQSAMGLRLVAGGVTAANTNAKRIRVSMGNAGDLGQVIWDSGALAADNDHWMVTCDGVRASNTSMRMTCTGQVYDAGPAVVKTTALTTGGFDGTRPLYVTGEATTTNDIQIHFFKVQVEE